MEALLIVCIRWLLYASEKRLFQESIKYIQTIAATPPLSDHIIAVNDPPASYTSEDQLNTYIKLSLESLKHPVGTAVIAPRDLNGVADPEFLVHGTQNLRVVDASVIPMQISAHTQTTVYAIGEKVTLWA